MSDPKVTRSRHAMTVRRAMTSTRPTVLWNDSGSPEELSSFIARNDAVGTAANPLIVLTVLKKEMSQRQGRIAGIIRDMPAVTEDEIPWRLTEEMSIRAAKLLEHVFSGEKGRNGRLPVQTVRRLYRNARAIVEQAKRFNGLAPNFIIKIPVTRAGLSTMEEATLSQAIAVAEAVEHGLSRREKEGKETSRNDPVCTLME